MLNQILTYALIISFLLSGCYSWDIVQMPEKDAELRITTKDNEQFELDTWQQTEEYIIGHSENSKEDNYKTPRKIKLADIDIVEEKSFDVVKTTLFVSGSAAVLAFAAYGMYYVSDKIKAVMEKF